MNKKSSASREVWIHQLLFKEQGSLTSLIRITMAKLLMMKLWLWTLNLENQLLLQKHKQLSHRLIKTQTMRLNLVNFSIISLNNTLEHHQLVLQENIGIIQIIDANLTLNQLPLALLAPTLMLHQPQNLAACIVFQII
jgi:hypothetical protein